jgi:hypothetical protein
MAGRIFWAAMLWLTLCGVAWAEARPLFSGGAAPLLVRGEAPGRAGSASLFVGSGTGGLSARLPARAAPLLSAGPGGEVMALLHLIARAEAGPAGYDAVQHGARIPPPRAPTAMTLGQIYAWIAATPGQPHAIGRYQFIPPTLRRVARSLGLGPDTRFSPEVQDRLAIVLLEEAGLAAFRNGEIGQRAFMGRLARIWAGLPLPNGRSYYEGHAGNRATMSWEAFATGIARIWPAG